MPFFLLLTPKRVAFPLLIKNRGEQLSLFGASEDPKEPGSRGGKFYRTKTGHVRYGEKSPPNTLTSPQENDTPGIIEEKGVSKMQAKEGVKETTLNLTTPGGSKVVVKLHSPHMGMPRVWVELPDKGLKGQGGAPVKLQVPKSGATYYISFGNKQAVGLTEAEAQKVTDAIAHFAHDYKESDEGKFQALKGERENLLLERAGWLDAMGESREHAMQSDTGSGWDKAKMHEAKAEAVTKKIEAFDKEHPEVVARLKAEKDESTRRFLAND